VEPVAGFFIVWLVFMLGSALVAALSVALWIWMIIDCVTRESDQGNDKLIWILVIVVVGPLGALIYLLVRRPERQRLLGR
jgi:hypothetical protein